MTFEIPQRAANTDGLFFSRGQADVIAVAPVPTPRSLVVTTLVFGLLLFSSISHGQTMTASDTESFVVAQASAKGRAPAEDRSIRPFKAKFRKLRSMTSAGASLRLAFPSAKPSTTFPKAFSSTSSSRWSSTGASRTTGAKPRRS